MTRFEIELSAAAAANAATVLRERARALEVEGMCGAEEMRGVAAQLDAPNMAAIMDEARLVHELWQKTPRGRAVTARIRAEELSAQWKRGLARQRSLWVIRRARWRVMSDHRRSADDRRFVWELSIPLQMNRWDERRAGKRG